MALRTSLWRCAKVRFKIIYNYLMSVEGKLILRRQAVGIKYCGGSFTHRVLGPPSPRLLEHAGTQANPSRLGRIGSQRGINTRLALIDCQLAFSRNWRQVVWNHGGSVVSPSLTSFSKRLRTVFSSITLRNVVSP